MEIWSRFWGDTETCLELLFWKTAHNPWEGGPGNVSTARRGDGAHGGRREPGVLVKKAAPKLGKGYKMQNLLRVWRLALLTSES